MFTATLTGNVVADASFKVTQNHHSVANFTVASNKSWIDNEGVRQEKTDYIKITAWGRLAQRVDRYVTKGRRVLLQGEPFVETWIDREGKTHGEQCLRLSFIEFQNAALASGGTEEENVGGATEEGESVDSF